MRIASFSQPSGPSFTAVDVGSAGRFLTIGPSLAQLLTLPAADFRDRLEAVTPIGPVPSYAELRAPIDGRAEVWAAGVTYRRSQAARMAESERSADIYERVYDAERPELFFKAAAWRVVGPGRPIAIRPDSLIDVPEPELAVVVNRLGEIVGYTICNDVSSRSIEGENPLYLPQAKTYLGSCALGPWITPYWDIADPYDLGIHLTIERDGAVAWQGHANTNELHRKINDLVEYLFRADEFPDGVVLSTGTSLVPDLPLTLMAGDVVRIAIDGLGELTNPVVRGKVALAWLTDRESMA
jgi:2-dehydro-3-deoxy-D-arabinonate dehydratase